MFAILRELYSTCLKALTGNVVESFFQRSPEAKQVPFEMNDQFFSTISTHKGQTEFKFSQLMQPLAYAKQSL